MAEFTHDELIGLLKSCRTNNARTGITGMLLYKGGILCSCSKGPVTA